MGLGYCTGKRGRGRLGSRNERQRQGVLGFPATQCRHVPPPACPPACLPPWLAAGVGGDPAEGEAPEGDGRWAVGRERAAGGLRAALRHHTRRLLEAAPRAAGVAAALAAADARCRQLVPHCCFFCRSICSACYCSNTP